MFTDIFCLSAFEIRRDLQHDKLSNVRFESLDGEIRVTWKLPEFNRAENILITVHSSDASYVRKINPNKHVFTIKDGVHGKLYDISVCELYKNHAKGDIYSKKLLFLDYNKLPDLPLLQIETAGGEDPPWSPAEKPDEKLMGATIENNEYLSGEMTFTWTGHETLSSKMKIRVRGNTSSYFGGKQSYKIHLHQSLDMLDLGKKYAGKDWQLLNAGSNLNYYTGEFLSEYCGMDWTAHGMLVNVMLNGDWRGLYYISQPVSRDAAEDNIGKDGYIFENDAYWWKKGTIYFKTNNQVYGFGYTFKYPDITDSEDSRITDLKNYMDFITNLITSENDAEASKYIDYQTFAAWILVRDIMKTGDGGGANIYYYLSNFDSGDYAAHKLKMGPVWDFDAMGIAGNDWSDQHISSYIFFLYLFDMPGFRSKYKEIWDKVAPTLMEDIRQYYDDLYINNGSAIDASRALDAARWEKGYTHVADEISQDKDFIHQRIDFINSEVKDW